MMATNMVKSKPQANMPLLVSKSDNRFVNLSSPHILSSTPSSQSKSVKAPHMRAASLSVSRVQMRAMNTPHQQLLSTSGASANLLSTGERESSRVREILTSAFGMGEGRGNTKKKTVVITGASSGLGKATVRALLKEKRWGDCHVIMACRDVDKAQKVADEFELNKNDYTVMNVELASLDSVKQFVKDFRKLKKPLDVLVCNAAVYLPRTPEPQWTADGYEMSLGVNHLSHFLLVNLLLPDLKKATTKQDPARVIIVGSITGNTNTVGGGAVLPFADLGDLQGLEKATGGKRPVKMMNGGDYNGAKAYKDSKLANMMTVLELHRRFHEETGIVFSSLYPGCIAETALFRDKRGWFRWFFPIFMKYVTGGYVSEDESGERLAQVCLSEDCSESGVYWSWNGGARTFGWFDPKSKRVVGSGGAGGEIFNNQPSAEVRDPRKAKKLWDLSAAAVGL